MTNKINSLHLLLKEIEILTRMTVKAGCSIKLKGFTPIYCELGHWYKWDFDTLDQSNSNRFVQDRFGTSFQGIIPKKNIIKQLKKWYKTNRHVTLHFTNFVINKHSTRPFNLQIYYPRSILAIQKDIIKELTKTKKRKEIQKMLGIETLREL